MSMDDAPVLSSTLDFKFYFGEEAAPPSPPVGAGAPPLRAPPLSCVADIPPTAVAASAGPLALADAGVSLGRGTTPGAGAGAADAAASAVAAAGGEAGLPSHPLRIVIATTAHAQPEPLRKDRMSFPSNSCRL
jgi:hypothetical protein